MARWALAREGEESEPSSEEEESEIDSEDDDAEVVEEQEEEQEEPEENPTAAAATTAAADTPGRTVQQRKQFNKIKLGGPSVCHVREMNGGSAAHTYRLNLLLPPANPPCPSPLLPAPPVLLSIPLPCCCTPARVRRCAASAGTARASTAQRTSTVPTSLATSATSPGTAP